MDLYAQIETIIKALRDHAQETWASILETDVEGGSTGTEILMAVRWHLQQLQNQTDSLPESLNSSINTTIQQINTALDN